MNRWTFLHACDMQPGSRQSFRFNPRFDENWQTARRQLAEEEAELLLVGGDLTRDGSAHDFEYAAIKSELDALPYPWHAIPGNMDTGNKHARVAGARPGRNDPEFNVTSAALQRFARWFGAFPWSICHRDVRFSGCYAAVAGSGLPEEDRLWQWLEDELPALPTPRHHVMTIHYPLFIDEPDEPSWDLTQADQYLNWYFSIDQPHRRRLLDGFKAVHVEIVLSGHIHCRRPPQLIEGIRFYKAAGIAMPQWQEQWPDGDPRLGYYRFAVDDDGIHDCFVPLSAESVAGGGWGAGGHVPAGDRDYSLARDEG